MDTNRKIFSGLQILVDQKWVRDHALIVEDKTIKAIIPVEMVKHHLPAVCYDFSPDHYLIPGLIDLHIHGLKGMDVMDATEEAFSIISEGLAEEGVTGFLATTMTMDGERIEAVLETVPNVMSKLKGAALLGIHLEGPFIAKAKMGAQNGEHAQLPDQTLIRKWQSLSKDTIKIVTLAPELSGSLALIHTLNEMGIIASIGHTSATYEETMAAVHAGCSQATHLFNAMSELRQREPGATGALLLSSDITAEIIVDGVHLHPAIVDLAYRMKGKDRLILVTDAIRAKCMGNGRYDLGGQSVEVTEQQVRLANGTLAGSVLKLPQAIKNMTAFSRCDVADAVMMASLNPAKALGIDTHKGSIVIGKDADLVVMNADLQVKMTMREGQVIYQLNEPAI